MTKELLRTTHVVKDNIGEGLAGQTMSDWPSNSHMTAGSSSISLAVGDEGEEEGEGVANRKRHGLPLRPAPPCGWRAGVQAGDDERARSERDGGEVR